MAARKSAPKAAASTPQDAAAGGPTPEPVIDIPTVEVLAEPEPAPVAPPEDLVTRGPYRWVRNPMYLAVLALIAGQALLFASGTLLAYGVVVAAHRTAGIRGNGSASRRLDIGVAARQAADAV